MADLQFQLIGGCEFRDATGQALPLSARKARALLAFLALQQGAPQSRERLAALLWEDADAELARSSLRQALSAIRRALPKHAHSLLAADTIKVSLDVAQLEVDVLRLRRLLAEETPVSLQAALALYQGELLEGFDARSGAFEEWIGRERRGLRNAVSAGAQALVRLSRSARDVDGELTALTRLIALEPLNEPAYRELMETCARAGRYTDALRFYQQVRAVLRRELDLAPEPATEVLYRELMRKRRATGAGVAAALPTVASDAAPADVAPASTAGEADDAVLRGGVVLVARLRGFSERQRALDPEDGRDLGLRLQRLVDEIAGAHGGAADRLAGEQLTVVFGLDTLRGNEPQRALHAARALREALARDAALAALTFSCGIARGPLLPQRTPGPLPLSGRAMGDAEALAGRAGPGEILLSEELRRAQDRRRAPLAGRHAELALAVSLLERAIASARGRTIVIRGEPGIGKTRLLEALIEAAAAQGVTWHRVQVLDFGHVEARRPLAGLVASLLGIAPESDAGGRARIVQQAIASGWLPAGSILHASGLVGAALSAELASVERDTDAQALERGRLEVVRRLVEAACAGRPLLLVIEDVHWASSDEAARLGELAACIAANRALLVMSTRPDEDPIDAAWRARARGCPVTTLDLAPLTDDEARELAAGYPELPGAVLDDCIRRAQGHPLFLEQLLRAAGAGEQALPDSVRALVLARMERLERRDRQALLAASVLGLRFPRAALLRMQDDPDYAPGGLVDADLLALEDREVVFVHALIRDAVYESLLKSTRRELHGRAAAWYAERDAGLSAGHLAEAGDPAAARAYLTAAGIEAEEFRLERALEFARRACDLAREPGDFGAARCLLGELLTRLGHAHDAIAMLREVVDLRASPELNARAWMGLANALRIMDRYDEALAALDRAENSLARRERPDLLARIWTLRGNIHFPRGELDACRDAYEQALACALRAGSPIDEARARGGLGDAWYQRGHMRTARDHFARCVAQARQQGSIGLALSNAPMLAITNAYCGEIRRALADCAELVEDAGRVGDLRSEILARDSEAVVCLYRADYPRARQTAECALELARRLGARRFEAELTGLLGHALGELGETAAAAALLQKATTLALEVSPTYCGPWCLGALALFTADAGRARSLLKDGEALLAKGCVSHNYLEFYRLALEFNLKHANWDEARRLAAALADYTRGEPLAWAELVMRRANWLADRAAGADARELDERLAALISDVEAMEFRWLLPALRVPGE